MKLQTYEIQILTLVNNCKEFHSNFNRYYLGGIFSAFISHI